MSLKLEEKTLTEQPVIEWFKGLGYEYKFGPDISPGGVLVERDDFKKVLLEDRLKASLRRLNPSLIEKAIDEVIFKIKKINFSNLELTNKEFYQLLKNGVRIDVRDKEGNLKGEFAKIVDFENPLNNDFLVVNQFTVQGFEKIRRPDVVIFINGIPIAIFELKNPTIEEATIKEAFNQLQEYKKDIPEIFKYNQILVISDLVEAKYGTISSSFEWFKKWRGIDDPDEKSEGVSELEILVKGIFQRSRLLDIIKNFIVFEADSEKETSKYTKKICLYHQYFGVNKAILKTLEKIRPKGDGKIGIFWHTQGSGKTLSMVFYVNKIREIKELKSPTFLFLTDRNDLDGQFYKTFLRTGYQYLAKQASTIEDLRNKLKNPGNEIIFTTIQKFADINEVLSEKENFIVIADEAHRSQYAILAAKARKALPNASFMGITATPIENNDRNIRYVFGNYIDKYTISQSIADGATVKIYYEGRLVPLHLTNYFIDNEFEDLTQEVDYPIKETLKKKITKLESLIMADNRLEKIANDIVYHYNNRPIEGKAMVVTISRNVAVKMYQLIKKIPNSPEVAVVVSNPQEFKDKIQKEIDNNELEKRFKNPDDPLKMVIVCDMWLTGFDVPSLTTMYFDKPLKNHTLMQAIARVNRVYKNKTGGLIVDYIGIADDLRKALNLFDSKFKDEALTSIEEIKNKMYEKYDIVKAMFEGIDYSKWNYLSGEKLAQLFQKSLNHIVTDPKTGNLDEKRKESFLKESLALIKLHNFVMPAKEAYEIKKDVDFFKTLRAALLKKIKVKTPIFDGDLKLEEPLKELVSKSIAAEGIIDIFSFEQKEKLDISLLDEKFLNKAKELKHKNLTIEILRKILEDELKIRIRKNRFRYYSLLESVQKLIESYENRLISASRILERLVELAKEIRKVDDEVKNIGLSEEELVFYDAIKSKKNIFEDEKLKKIVKDLVREIRRDLIIDWTNNEIIKARIRDKIRFLLLKNNIKTTEIEPLTKDLYEQSFYVFKDYNFSS